jgi:HK97 family phage prohead protease
MELENIHLTFASQIESSDAGRRLISGVVLPFNTVGNTSAGPVKFESGSVEIPEANRIKLLAQHSQNDPIGRALSFQVTQEKIYGTFKVSASQKGNDYLIMAQEELISSLSIGVDVIKAKKDKDGVLVVSAARMVEVSLVESPAYPDAIVTKVAASEGDAVEENQPKQESEAILDNKAPEPTEEKAEAATPIVEASRPVTSTPFISTSVRSPINDFASYTEHKIKAALGSDESRLFISAADDSFSTNPAFNPTQYLSEFVTNTRFGTPTIDACSQGVLPATGMTISVPSLVTSIAGGTGVAPVVTVEAEAGAVQNTGMETVYLNGTVQKYSGMNTLSVELLERSGYPGFYSELTQQLQNAYLTAIDTAALTALLAAGTNASAETADSTGIIDYTAQASSLIYKNTGYFAQNYIANPAQYQALLGATDTTGRPIYNAIQPMNAAGQVAPSSIRGNVLGLDLYVDKNFTETTFDDNSAVILAPEAFTVYRSPQAYMSVNVVSNLQVQIAIYGFMATIAKMPYGIIKYAKI